MNRHLSNFVCILAALAGACRIASPVHAAIDQPGGSASDAVPAPSAAGRGAPAALPTRAIRGPLKVVVSIPPLKGLVEPLLPEGSTIQVLIPPGVSEHAFELSPSKLAAVVKADVVVTVGLGLDVRVEDVLRKRQGGDGQDAEAPLPFQFAQAVGISAAAKADAHDHDHDHDHGAHEHGPECGGGDGHAGDGAADPHVWLDPVLARQFAASVAASIEAGLKQGGASANALKRLADAREKLDQQLTELDRDYRAMIEASDAKTVVVAHDAYSRLAARYGFKTAPLAGLHAEEPTPGAIEAAIKALRAHAASHPGAPLVVFVEPQLSRAAADRVAKAAGARVLTLDPLGSGDYVQTMRANLEALRMAMPARRAAPNAVPSRPSPPSQP